MGSAPSASLPPKASLKHGFSNRITKSRPKFRALCIGINYWGQGHLELTGSTDDALAIAGFLSGQGFQACPEGMLILTDSPTSDLSCLPTKENILQGISWLVQNAEPGDVLFFHFAGHGAQIADTDGDELDNKDEAILPVDFLLSGCILDDLLFELLVAPLPQGVHLTAVMDCCHSGTGLDLPFVWEPDNRSASKGFTKQNNKTCKATVLLLSGCADGEQSVTVHNLAGVLPQLRTKEARAGGLMSHAFIQVLQAGVPVTCSTLLKRIRRLIELNGFRQSPQLSASHPFDVTQPFQLDGKVIQFSLSSAP
eukprot:TRINITY_DN84115_c0_g1_i1.p1 TRINITY_DN84115_c0_g1~~TRINITY_DN84115_c0_g1_i1.p1  ORF type:complete len:310 (+),score=16.94 TRINITY_DN84115_c0_g1_i1:63-992(+)